MSGVVTGSTSSSRRLPPAQRAVFGVAFFTTVAMVLLLLTNPVDPSDAPLPADEPPFTVQFANGARIDGIARHFSETFTTAGFTTGDPLDTMEPASRTVVYYRDDRRQAARRVAAQLGTKRVEALARAPAMSGPQPTAEIVVVLGSDQPPLTTTTAA